MRSGDPCFPIASWNPSFLEMASTSVLASGKGNVRSNMKEWLLARPPLGNKTGRTFDEKSHMYFVCQDLGTISGFF